MTKVMFIDLFVNIYDLHGIYSLSSAMKGHDIAVYLARDRNYKKVLRKISDIRPDLLLYSAISSTLPVYSEFDRMAKRAFGLKSLIGGPGPTFDPKYIEDSTIDAACIGEGELALVDFINSGFQSNKNIFYKKEKMPSEFYPLVKLDDLPFPDRQLAYDADPLLRNMPSKQFLSGKGCPYECTYCFNHKFNMMFRECGPIVRKKSVGRLIEEIRFVQKRYPMQNIVFSDDTFILDKKWFLEFCERFPKEIGLTYTCNIRANLIDDSTVKALKESNCVGVNWSIESGNDFFRNEVLKRRISREQILDTSELLTKYKIPYRIGNIIGLPGEGLEQMLETLELNIKARPSLGLANIFVPFPGLGLTEYAIDGGYYKPDAKKGLPRDFFTKSVMEISPAENRTIQKLMCWFPIFVRFPALFYNVTLRNTLLRFHTFLLRVPYELFYTFNMMKIYVAKSPFFHRCRMATRYFVNLLG